MRTTYHTVADLDPQDRTLLEAAVTATHQAYAPYSHFYVGAAVRTTAGTIYAGGNQENASYPLCLCAERVAIAAAHASSPGVPIAAIAVTARNPAKSLQDPIPPCGACRQVIRELELRFEQPVRVIFSSETGRVQVCEGVAELLPFSFGPRFL